MGGVELLGSGRTSGEVVSPTLSDPLARVASAAVGGPLGRHARTGRSWWTPLRVVLAVATVVFGLGVVQKSPCVVENWSDVAFPKAFSHLCYTDIPYLYVDRGLAEGIVPYEPASDLPIIKQPLTAKAEDELTIEYPVLTGAWMGAAAVVTRALGSSPDVSDLPHDSVGSILGVQHDSALFWSVNAVGFFLVLLLGLVLLVRAQPRRPWDAMLVAASPSLALAATINWDLVAFGWVAAMLWAWSTRRPVLAGVFIGLGAATKLYQLFLLGPLIVLCLRERRWDVAARTAGAAAVAWLVVDLPIYIWSPHAFLWFWKYNASRGPDFGSLWLVWANWTEEGIARGEPAHDQRDDLARLRGRLRGHRVGRTVRPSSAPGTAAHAAGHRGVLPRQQGVLTPVRPVAAAPRRAGPSPLARPDHLAGLRGFLLLRDLDAHRELLRRPRPL